MGVLPSPVDQGGPFPNSELEIINGSITQVLSLQILVKIELVIKNYWDFVLL